MKILHTADIHLKEYNDERWQALQQLIAIGREEGIEIFVISGDLFDRGIDAEDLRPHIRALFSDIGFKICLIPGNHDRDAYSAGVYFGEDAVILTDVDSPFEYKGVKILGIPFEPIEGERILHKLHVLANILTPDTINIVLYHGELLDAFFSREDFGDEGPERYMPVKLSYFKDLKNKFPGDMGTDVLQVMVKEGLLIKVKEDLYFHRGAIEDLKHRLIAFLKEKGELSTPQFKDMTGVSRKYTIPLIEYFDRSQVTVRVGDSRVLRKK